MRALGILFVLFLAVVLYGPWEQCGADSGCWRNAFVGHPGNYRSPTGVYPP